MAKKSETTSSKIAAIAANGLAHPESLNCCEIAAVCGSALTQYFSEIGAVPAAKKKRKSRKKGGRPKGLKNKKAKS